MILGRLIGTGELETLPVQMVLRSVGYQSVPLLGVPFDERSSTVPNEAGRVLGPTVSRCPASTWRAGSSAGLPA